jgi:hypothetical protein
MGVLMSFGRKGLPPGENAGGGLRNGGPAARISRPAAQPGADDDLTRKREAFLAAERARKGKTNEAGLSEYAQSYTAMARPKRSLVMAYVLWWTCGGVSAHRFYLGALQSAFIQLGTMLLAIMLVLSADSAGAGMGLIGVAIMFGWGIWVIGDVLFIHKIHRKHCRQANQTDVSVFA